MLFITRKGKSNYRIVIPKDTTPSVITASTELVKYIFDISGAYLRVVCDCKESADYEICIGFTNRDCGVSADELEALGSDGFIIKALGTKLFILGSDVRGALYGVYSFLEKFCNCRFYTDDFERIPKCEDIVVPDITVREVPVFEYRNTYWHSQAGEFISAKLKNNGGMGHTLTERVGGGIEYNGAFCHTLGYLAGLCKKDEAWWDNPCLTDENVYQTVLSNVKAELRAFPDKKIISVSQLDGNNGECKCERCRKIAEEQNCNSATLVLFINRLQEEIKEEFPDVQIDTLAYRFSRKPPKDLTVHPDAIVRLCNIECCFRHSIDECDESPAYSNIEETFENNLKRWSKLTNHLYIWDYTTNFTNSSTIFPNFEALRKNARFFAENGVTGVFEQGNIASLNGEFGELRGYLLCKLLWNPYMTEEEYQGHIKDFITDFYGEAAPLIKKFFDMTLAYSEKSHFGCYFDNSSLYVFKPWQDSREVGAEKFAVEGMELFDKAEAICANNAFALANVRRARIQMHNYKNFVLQGRKVPDGERDALNAEIYANNKKQFELMRDGGIVENREFAHMDYTKEPDFLAYALQW